MVLSLRNYRPDTNLDVAVRAFADVVAAEPRARLVLAARRGPLRGELEKLVADLGLNGTVVLHRAEWVDLPGAGGFGRRAPPSPASDSTPASLLEAMATGLPAVCGIAPSIDEWVARATAPSSFPAGTRARSRPRSSGSCVTPSRRRAYGERNSRVVRERIGDPGLDLEQLYRELVAA